MGGEGEGSAAGVAVDEYEDDKEGGGRGDGGGGGGFCSSSLSEIEDIDFGADVGVDVEEAGDEGRDKDSNSSALGFVSDILVNAIGVPKDDVEELEEGSAAAGTAPGKGGGGGGTIVPDTLGSSGSSPNSRVFVFLIGATYGEGTEDVEDVDDNIVGVKLNIVEGWDKGRGWLLTEEPELLALDETGTRTEGFFTFCCDDADDDTEDVGVREGNKGEKEISGENGIALRGLSLSAVDV